MDIIETDFFYSEKGRRKEFKIRKDKVLLHTKSISDAKRIASQPIFLSAYNLSDARVIATIDALKISIEELLQIQDVTDAAYFPESSGGALHAPTNQIFVKPKKGLVIKELIEKSRLNGIVETIKLIDDTNEIYLVTLDIKIGETLALTRQLFESGLFEFAEPSFLRLLKPYNTYFSNRWGFKNTGQYGGTIGIDIRAEPAWDITNGSSSIKVAVIDEGVDLTHPDLQANLLSGYDAIPAVNNPGGANGSPYGNNAHGTACAGIIAAINNTAGIRGIASNVKIVPVRIGYIPDGSTLWVTCDAWIVDGINYARNNADILSNSWGFITEDDNYPITNAINNATSQGCIVVFASGNSNVSTVSYPASLSNVIAVGAVSPCGQRKSPTSCDTETAWGAIMVPC
jgi:subtilisin family serine protease